MQDVIEAVTADLGGNEPAFQRHWPTDEDIYVGFAIRSR